MVVRLAIGCLTTLVVLTVLVMGVWVYVVNNVEQPEYRVVRQDGAIEIRDYPVLVVAEVSRQGDRKSAISAGFRALAGYIFAKDRGGKTIAMTAPVTQERVPTTMGAPVTQAREKGGDGEGWVVRFIMPAQYTQATLPRPKSHDVRLRSVGPARRAAIRFSGVATDRLLATKEGQLRDWLGAQGLQASAASTYAYYNNPFTPGPLRRNEVIIDILDGSDAR
jgi:SOUL heme-binding protein